MIVKPIPAPADPNKVCRTCGHYCPNLEVCAADDSFVTEADAKVRSCNDWEPRKEKLSVISVRETIGMDPVNPVKVPLQMQTEYHGCHNCIHWDPSKEFCEHGKPKRGVTGIFSCENWESRKVNVFTSVEHIIGMDPVNSVRVPLQPDGSPKMQARETIGAETVNADAVVRLQTLCDEAEPCKAKLTFQYQEKQKEKPAGWDHQLEAKAIDRGAKQGMTQEALDTVFAIACQQVPSMEKRWMELKAEIGVMFAQKWAAEDMPE